MTCIVADIGGTHVRFAIARRVQNYYQFEALQVMNCNAFTDFDSAFGQWLESLKQPYPTRACFAVAGVLEKASEGGCVKMTNLGWHISAPRLRQQFNFEQVRVVNDFAALALSLPRLNSEDMWALRDIPNEPKAPMVVLGPGSGLGMAGLIFADGRHHVVMGEGGFVNLSAGSHRELELVQILARKELPPYSEYVLSGGGLVNLYHAVCTLNGAVSENLTPPEISRRGLDNTDSLCRQTLLDFLNFLGSAAGDAALYFGAKGGVFLGGGILPRIKALLPQSQFEQRFVHKGYMKDWLQNVRIQVLNAGHPALIGAAAWLEN
ncbi:MAG: glucokinase [Gammaproteobacteria bacterium]|nr:glucokinase [Gammaproteobacteria bacterium]